MRIAIKHNLQIWILGGLLLVDGVFFFSINPQTTPLSVLMLGFLFLLLTDYYVFEAILSILGAYSKGLQSQHQRLAVLLTVISGSLLALQSIGQLTLRDALVLVPLVTVIYIYATYVRSRPVS